MADITDRQKQLVQQSFGSIADEALAIGRRFYERFFEREPDVRNMFPPDLTVQQQKFVHMLAALVAALNDEASLTAMLRSIGTIHAHYGVTQAHFEMGEEILMGAFADVLADQFTPEVESAWRALYHHMVTLATDIPEFEF